MWKSLTQPSITSVELLIRALAVYFIVILLLRISGKRQLGQMNATEFVAILLISNAVQNSMNGGDNSLVGGVFLAGIIIAASWFIDFITFRSGFMRRIFEGSPTLLIHDAKIIEKNLRKERITHAELKIMMRKQDIHQIETVRIAILEADGGLSIVKY